MDVGILTNFFHIKEGYSLTGIVLDQCRMLHEHGHSPILFVGENFTGDIPEYITLHKIIPRPPLIDYTTKKDLNKEHAEFVHTCSEMLIPYLEKSPLVLTHDFIFTGWNMPYALMLMKVTNALPHIQFRHFIHSIPTFRKDWWAIADYGLDNNKIIFPNGTDSQRVALQFRGHISNVEVIPHIKDLRSWFDFSKDSCDLIATIPSLMQADFVMVYPAGTDRLTAKRADVVIKIFAELKKLGYTVCLLFANQEAHNLKDYPVKREKINECYQLGEKGGLIKRKDFDFVSQVNNGQFRYGLSKRELREIFLCSNLFISPTREESFSLVLPESALSGSKIMVFNSSLGMMHEVTRGLGIGIEFGSYHKRVPEHTSQFYKDVAIKIVEEFNTNKPVQYQTFVRKNYNYDYLYKYFYKPIIDDVISTQTIRNIL